MTSEAFRTRFEAMFNTKVTDNKFEAIKQLFHINGWTLDTLKIAYDKRPYINVCRHLTQACPYTEADVEEREDKYEKCV